MATKTRECALKNTNLLCVGKIQKTRACDFTVFVMSSVKNVKPTTASLANDNRLVGLPQYVTICVGKKDGEEVHLRTVVNVCLISRYLQNSKLPVYTCVKSHYLYDVICTDDSLISFKVVLDPKYNHLIQKNLLKHGSTICIHRAIFREENCRLTPNNIKQIKYMHVLELQIKGTATKIVDLDTLKEHHLWKVSMCDVIFPLNGARRYYLDVWNDSIPVFLDMQLHDKGYLSMSLKEMENRHKRYQNLLEKLKDHLMMHQYNVSQVIVVRILCIVNLHHYGQPNDGNLCPYGWFMVITDGNSACALSIWGEAVKKLYNRIRVGSVILITDYTICYAKMPRWSRFLPLYGNLTWLPLEIKLNYVFSDVNNSFGEPVHILCPEEDYLYPIHREAFDFKSANEIWDMDDNSIVDVVGIVKRISRYERSAKGDTGINCVFWIYYWVEIIDALRNIIRLRVNVNSQDNVHRHMEVGQAVIFINMKLVKLNNGIMWFLKSGTESHSLLLQNNARKRYKDVLAVMDVVNSMNFQMLESLEEIGGIGGGYFCPHPPPSPDDSLILSSEHWEPALHSLVFWQHNELLVRAQIVEVLFVSVNMPEAPRGLPLTLSRQCHARRNVYSIFVNPNWSKRNAHMLGLTSTECNVFPHKYNRKQPSSRPSWFPVVENPTRKTDAPISLVETSTQCSGYYNVILSDLQKDVALSCIFNPCCCNGLNRSIWERLVGEGIGDAHCTSAGCATKCTWEEVSSSMSSEKSSNNVKRPENQAAYFLLSAFKHDESKIELVLRLMYKIK